QQRREPVVPQPCGRQHRHPRRFVEFLGQFVQSGQFVERFERLLQPGQQFKQFERFVQSRQFGRRQQPQCRRTLIR
ncbi:MAG: hypothetical protein K2N02_05245, partial [Alistipes sp.]|nr:hypothetical protein [Alistipes sp.]